MANDVHLNGYLTFDEACKIMNVEKDELLRMYKNRYIAYAKQIDDVLIIPSLYVEIWCHERANVNIYVVCAEVCSRKQFIKAHSSARNYAAASIAKTKTKDRIRELLSMYIKQEIRQGSFLYRLIERVNTETEINAYDLLIKLGWAQESKTPLTSER